MTLPAHPIGASLAPHWRLGGRRAPTRRPPALPGLADHGVVGDPSLSRHVVLRADYGAGECTLQVYGEPIAGSIEIPKRWLDGDDGA
jgi:hypothetical protein